MQAEAQALQAEGIVGVQIQEKSHGWGTHMIEFFAIGTAVVPIEGSAGFQSPTPVISLDS